MGAVTLGDGTITGVNAGGMDGVPFASGTAMLFQQTTAPTGWTKQTTHDNKALRVVSGTAGSGGSVNFTTAFTTKAASGTVGSTTLTTTQIPSHRHTVGISNIGAGGPANAASGNYSGPNSALNTSFVGGSGSHTHSFTGSSIDLTVQYVDIIIATKD